VVHDSTKVDHLAINCSDLARSAAFYDAVLGVLGHTRVLDYDVAIGYGTGKPDFWIGAQPPTGPASGANREVHVAFTATSAEAVREFFSVALAHGAEVLHEPRHRPEYHDHYYGAFVRDPDGNNVEAVCHTVAPG
jgi:catechol 2,3-dioxygenase-like lactoylglutathione lyase family enzyme